MRLNTYLNFDGECEAAFNYYAQHLGGRVVMLMKYRDSPLAASTPAESLDRVLHGRYELDGFILMGSDCTPERRYEPIKCANVVINIDDVAEAERIFNALADGGNVRMPLQETFWANRFGTTTDRFGVPWMVNCEKSA